MHLPGRHLLLGMTLGAVCATAIAMTGHGMVIETFADEFLSDPVAPGFDPATLVFFEDRAYQVDNEDWVSTKPLSTEIVKKVEAGRVSYVTIATTETGTYSTDAMFSDHVQYPGISVEEVPGFWHNHFYYLGGGSWHSFSSSRGNSFFSYRSGSTRISSWGDLTCVSGKGFSVCD